MLGTKPMLPVLGIILEILLCFDVAKQGLFYLLGQGEGYRGSSYKKKH